MSPILEWLATDSILRNMLFVFCLAILWIVIDAFIPDKEIEP